MAETNAKPTKEEIDAGINAWEDEHCKELADFGKRCDAAGATVPGADDLPELLDDGSYADPDLNEPTD